MKSISRMVMGVLLIAALPLMSSALMDHSMFIPNYQGAQSCEMCHPGKIAELQNTVHYKFESPVPENYLHDEEGNVLTIEKSGKLWKLCGYPTTVPQFNWMGKLKDDPTTAHIDVPGGCAKCHIGIGVKPFSATGHTAPQANEANNIDCLICHSQTYERKFYVATQGGEPVLNALGAPVVYIVPQVDGVFDYSVYQDDLKTIDQPQSDYCNRCHAAAGGGKVALDDQQYSFKRGTPYAPGHDVHATAGLSCADCHSAGNHQTKRPLNNDLYAYDNIVDHEMCLDCHGAAPHTSSPTYNMHTSSMSCTTCHATSDGGVIHKDFAEMVPPADGDPLGLYNAKLTFADETFKLEYLWFNGTVHGEIVPAGAPGDGKIYPYKAAYFNQPVDADGNPVPLRWGIAYTTGDVPAAANKGRELYAAMWSEDLGAKTGLPPVPGQFAGYKEGHCGYFSISHAITKENALTCKSCHSYTGVMNLDNLYDAARADVLKALLGDTPPSGVKDWSLF
jgi:hypothetical protein